MKTKMLCRTVPELPLPEGTKKKLKVDGREFAFLGRHSWRESDSEGWPGTGCEASAASTGDVLVFERRQWRALKL